MVRAKTEIKPEYQLKYRLVGAGIMVVAAVVLIPVLLQEPGIEASTQNNSVKIELDETFKSKIEPLTLDNVNKKLSISDEDFVKPALVKGSSTSETESINAEQDGLENTEEQVDAVVTAATSTDQNEGETVVLIKEESSKTVASFEQTEEDLSDLSEGNSGWTVRVGTFSKTENVETISTLLNDSGFNARHTKVQTTLGEAIRVWLGLYSEKKTAEKVNTRLKSLTGEKGYVTKHTP